MKIEEYGLKLEDLPFNIQKEMYLYEMLYGQVIIAKTDDKYTFHYVNSEGVLTEKDYDLEGGWPNNVSL